MKKNRLLWIALCTLLFAVLFGATALGAVARGDVDFNGELEVTDARYALRAAVGLEVYPEGTNPFIAADVNGNGEIEVSDARTILRAAVGLDLLSYNEKFYMPLTIADTDDFSVTLVRLFYDDMLQGLELDLKSKHEDHVLEIDGGDVAFNGYEPDSSYFNLELYPGESRTVSILFDRTPDASTFIYGWIRDLQIKLDVFDVTAGNENFRPPLFNQICSVDPNRVDEDDHSRYEIPIANDQILRSEPRFTFASWGVPSARTDEYGYEPELVQDILLPIYCRNDTGHMMYFSLEDFDLGYDRISDSGGKFLFPHANGCATLVLDVRDLHIYLSDLGAIGFTLRVWDSTTQEILYTDRYYIDFGQG